MNKPIGPELDENIAALRRMRVIGWALVAGFVDLVCCVVVLVVWKLF